MCSGDRIRHHIKHHDCKKYHTDIVGFTVGSTTGRRLIDGNKQVRILDEKINVQAQLHSMGSLSACADQARLTQCYGHFKNHSPLVLVHDETYALADLTTELNNHLSACNLHNPNFKYFPHL